MSEATASGTETIYVRLLDEAVDVWRPVQALALGGGRYRVGAQAVPEDEAWEFVPGEVVDTERRGSAEQPFRAAVTTRARSQEDAA